MLFLLLLLWGIKGMEGGREDKEGFSLNVERKIVVQEGLCVLVPCNFSYPGERWHDSDPVHKYWFQEGARENFLVASNNPNKSAVKRTRGRFFLLREQEKNDCSLNITEIRKKDSGTYIFRLEKGETKYNYVRNKMTLDVTALTDTPRILLPETLEAGQPSNLTCSVPWGCEWRAPPTFSWTGTSVSLLSTNATGSSVLTIIPQLRDHGTNLTCQVTLPGTGVMTRTTIRLNVSYAPKNLTVTVYQGADSVSTVLENGSSLPISEGQPLRLMCSADSYPPAHLSWSWDNLTLCPSKLSNPGLLELFPVHLKHGGVYTCRAQHGLGSQHISLSLSPQQRRAALSEMMTGSFMGAGVTALVSLTFCVILLAVRSFRKKPARPTVVAPHPNALKASVSQSPLVESKADDSSEPLPSTAEEAPSPTEEELHYASLSFHEMKPRDSWVQQYTATEYSEIKFHK